MKKRTIGLLLLSFICFASPYIEGQEKVLNPGELYDSAMEFYYKGKGEEAIQVFLNLIQSAPDSRLVPYSKYMIGLCYLKMERDKEAIQQLEIYLRLYPDGDRVREAERGIQIAKERLKAKALLQSPVLRPVVKPSLRQGKEIKRRICAQVFYHEGKNLEEFEKSVKVLKSAGVNTILFRVFQNKGDRHYPFAAARHERGVYFKTEYAPVVDDILGEIAEIVHRNGLEIFAWITTRYANYGLEGHSEYRCLRYNFETKKMEMARGFNLFHPDVLKRLEGLFRDLGRHPIDGILFQDDLILRHNEDFSTEANQAFQKEFMYLPHPDLFYINPYQSESGKYYVKGYTDRFWTWANWKNRWLMNVASRLMDVARESNPKLQFAINLYFEAVLNDLNGLTWFSQTLSGAFKRDFDYYAIMAYHRQAMKNRKIEMKKAIDLMAEATQKAVEVIADPSKVMTKVWITDWKGNEAVSNQLTPRGEIEDILKALLIHGDVSLAFVPYINSFPLHLLKRYWTPSQ